MPNYDDLAQALASEGAAFGVFPQMSGRRRLQDAEAAKNIPVDILRGQVAGLLGAIPDLLNMSGRSPMPTETFGDTQYEPTKQLPYGSEHYLKTLPLAPTTQTGRVANEMGALVPLDPRTVVKAGKPVVSLLGNELARGMYGNEGSLANVIPTAMKPKMLDVYHGTPHTLPPTERNLLGEFDASKIGTGEGAQAYGHGIYVAENPEVATGYAKNVKDMGSISNMNAELSRLSKIMDADSRGGYRKFKSNVGEEAAQKYDELMTKRNAVSTAEGNLYKADLPDEMIPKMLDWDKPLTEQKSVMSAIRSEAEQRVRDRMLGDIENNIRSSLPKPDNVENNYLSLFSNENVAQNQEIKNQAIAKLNKMDINSLVDKELQSMKPADMTWDMTGKQFYELLSKQSGSAKQASKIFKNQGIPGIKYLDEGSRQPGVASMTQAQLDARISTLKKDIGSGLGNQDRMKQILSSLEQERASHPKLTHNFVVFPGEEQNIKILERNAEKTTK